MNDQVVQILLVEDSPTDADLVMELLGEAEAGAFEFVSVPRLQDALTKLSGDATFDVVLLDLGLPDSQGLSGLEKVLEVDPNAVVIVLTGQTDRNLGVQAVRVGAQDYLTKGKTNSELLMQSIRHARERAQKARDLAHEVEDRKRIGRELRMLFELAQSVAESDGFDRALSSALRIICEYGGWAYGEAWVQDDDGNALICAPSWYGNGAPIKAFRRHSEKLDFAPGRGLAGRVWQNRRAEWIPDCTVLDDTEFCRAAAARQAGLNAAFGIPITASGTGLAQAVLVFLSDKPRRQDDRLVKLIETTSHSLSSSLQRTELVTALTTSEERFRALIENVHDSIMTVGPDGTIRYRSPTAEELFGYESGGAMGNDAFSSVHPEDRDTLAAQVSALVEDPRDTTKAEFRVRRKDGVWRHCAVVGKNAMAIPGIDGILLTVRDVTEEKRAEASLRKLSRAIEQSTNLVVITDHDGTIEYVNRAVENITGYAVGEVMGRTPAVWKSDRTPREVYANLWQTITRGNDWHGEFENRRKDGSYHRVKATISPIRTEDGVITHFIGVEDDVTKASNLEEQLRQAQKMEAVGQLTGGIAHDFNNLLMVILGNLELLEEALDESSRLLKWARAARRASERGADLTARLLAFSRRQVLEPRIIDLNDCIRGIRELVSRTLREDIDLQFHLINGLPPVRLDPGQFEHALLNLVVNARDAMPESGQLTIETSAAELDADYAGQHAEVTPGDYVMVAVSDTGTGMAPAQIQRAFEPFYTTKDPSKGTGLGLSMVYGFVKQSGGHVKIYSEPDQGTTVKLYFPRSERLANADDAAPAGAVEKADGGERILVVEDDPEVRKVLEAMLEQLGYRTITAKDGAEALQRLDEAADIDLLLTDVVMSGGMDGPELAAEVTARRPEIKVLFSSGYAEEALRRRGQFLNGANWIGKPYSMDRLAQRLRHVLGTEPT